MTAAQEGAGEFPYVTDAAPGARMRRATAADAMMHVNDDGTVTIPEDVEVVDIGDSALWFRCPRLRGWAGEHKQSPIVADPSRSLHVAIAEELRRQGRFITRWKEQDAQAAKLADIAYWREMDEWYRLRWSAS